ncbi:hypothetical protein D9757_006053 [Collybiopsis confluens]|uniref:Mitochondrial import inner membrane translocase subunit TIM50 n=1 Tax=Collybiopsis confluens TaxID=2823264 RepID=A0A8H5HV16_9AGAR|nr:hypothetical protein D9757_006053 [Collybiopsis confluens]
MKKSLIFLATRTRFMDFGPHAKRASLFVPSRSMSSAFFPANFTSTKAVLDPTYISVTRAPSTYISLPASQRKLLVLDLNGTLLFRPKGKSKQGQRTVHPRPYIPSLRQYLFHEKTKTWLDTMVWSSAQGHNVGEMVKKVFTVEGEMGLKAVWARDTLDLDPKFYHKKTVTIKDLNKIWKTFPVHNAKTTLLVDDSTQKARLQPWNHVYVKEYGQLERRDDLIERNRRAIGGKEGASTIYQSPLLSANRKPEREQAGRSLDLDTLPKMYTMLSELSVHDKTSLDPSTYTHSTPSSSNGTSTPSDANSTTPLPSGLDSILLALIGILDTIKHQDNVSAWLRSGGIVLCGASDGVGGGTGAMLGNGATIGDRWFDTVHIINWWGDRGKRALEELGIGVVEYD